ncbi:MAG: hypothetical protein ACEQSN_06245 [Yersinia sp. (in: enterobacteria)]
MSNLQDLVDNAMQSCIEGYAVSVVDSIEFELKRELSTEEHRQVYAAVDRAITGIDAAQKEINNLKIKLSDAGCLLVEWKKRVEKAEKERDDLLNQEFQQRLANAEHQLYMKDLAIHNIKASRKAQFRKRLAAEAALSAANEKLKGDQVPMFEVEISCSHWLNMGPISGADLSKLPDGINKLFTAPQKPVALLDK